MADESEVVTPSVVDEDESAIAHVPITDNGRIHSSTVKDHENPYSVWSVSPLKMREAIDRIPHDLFLLPDDHLYKLSGGDQRIKVLRVSFQREYERVMTSFQRLGHLTPMRMSNIFGGICSEGAFTRLIQRPECIAYMCSPVADYHDSLKSLQSDMIYKYQEILRAPLYDDKGNFKASNASVVLEAMKSIEDRLFGKSLQRVSSENKSVQVTVPMPNRSVKATTDMMLVLEHRVKELQAELYGIRKLGEPGQLDPGATSNAMKTPSNFLADAAKTPGYEERVLAQALKEGGFGGTTEESDPK